MGKRKVTILDTASDPVAEAAYFVEGKGLTQTAKKFVAAAFEFFAQLSDDRIEHHPCTYPLWKSLNYHYVTYKKYAVASLYFKNEIVICEFVPLKLIHWYRHKAQETYCHKCLTSIYGFVIQLSGPVL